ncbi:uncharacterized protein LOC129012684 isoform X2 [Pongo pygmaeus]|uniref:uncharacterized protein LOC129012684 isoform X2 n=1 Tax=Pongo pygmaeus TaxID=9600 RepID=UPI00300C51BF
MKCGIEIFQFPNGSEKRAKKSIGLPKQIEDGAAAVAWSLETQTTSSFHICIRERKKNYNHFPLTHQPINLQIKAIKKQSKCEEGRKCDEEILWRKQLPLLPWDLPIVLTELAFESQMRSVCPEVTTSSPPSPWLAKSGRLQCFLKTRGEFITLASKSAAVHLENNFLKVNVFA